MKYARLIAVATMLSVGSAGRRGSGNSGNTASGGREGHRPGVDRAPGADWAGRACRSAAGSHDAKPPWRAQLNPTSTGRALRNWSTAGFVHR